MNSTQDALLASASPQSTYQHTQPGTLIRVALAVSLIFVVGLGFALDARASSAIPVLAVVAVVLAVCLVLFHSLEVRVDDEAVNFAFGIGWISKRIPLAEIASVRAVRNPWYYGWGLHLMPSGWIYNVSGLEGVELELASGKRLRIGTDEPLTLVGEIETRLASAS